MGIVDVVSEYCSLPRTRRHLKKRKQFQVHTYNLFNQKISFCFCFCPTETETELNLNLQTVENWR